MAEKGKRPKAKVHRSNAKLEKIVIFLVFVVVVIVGAGIYYKKSQEPAEKYEFEGNVISENQEETLEKEHSYSVSTSNDIATAVGMSVLEKGGNAVDAAIAVAYTLGVVEPYASGIGGSGGMLVYNMKTEECEFFDYRASSGDLDYSYDNIAVPGFVAGMEAAHEAYGTIAMADLIEPAVQYAENGFEIYGSLGYRINSAVAYIEKYSMFYDEKGNWVETGDMLYQEDLAETLRAIQDGGAEVFYKGYIAEDIAENTSLSKEDIANYKVLKGDVAQGTFEGYTVYGAGAPLSGTTLVQMLEMADSVDIVDPTEDVNKYVEQLGKITNSAYASRYKYITDPSLYEVDEEYLTSEEHIEYLLSANDLEYADEEESMETTSFSIVDSNGLAVSCTNTLSDFWGSRVKVDGIFLNDTNVNFSEGINKYEPNKRSRTFTSPTIVVGDDGYVMAIGTPGGSSIPCLLFNVIVDVLKFDMDPQEAIDKSIVICKRDVLYVEADKNGETWLDTSKLQKNFVWQNTGAWWGCVSFAGYSDEAGAFAAYDFRRGATMAGVSK